MNIFIKIFYIIFIFVLVECSLGIAGYIYGLKTRTTDEHSTYRILTLGESTTVTGGDGSYPAQLEKILNEKGEGKVNFSVINKGIIATNTSIIVANVENYIRTYKPQIIIAMMGINDSNVDESLQNHFTPRKILKSKFDIVGIIQNMRTSRMLYLSYITFRQMVTLFWDTHMINNITVLSKKLEDYSKNQPYENTEKLIRRIIALHPTNPDIYTRIADVYQLYYQYEKKHQILELAISRGVENGPLMAAYCITLFELDLHNKVLEISGDMIKKYPNNDQVYTVAGHAEFWVGSPIKAKEYFMRAIELNKSNLEAYEYLAKLSKKFHEYDDAKLLLQQALVIDPRSKKIGAEYFSLLYDLREKQEAQSVVLGASTEQYLDMTIANYLKLIQIAKKYNITVLIMQYPLRKTYDLMVSLLSYQSAQINRASDSGFFAPPYSSIRIDGYPVIFVDNEANFKNALLSHSYDDLFVDRFAANFGHATALGNSLIANNLANAIFDNYINQRN